MAGRYIGENIRIIYDLFNYTETENIPGLLLLVDFEKAFDSVSWKFMDKVLDFFNFGPSFKKWVEVLYKNIKACILVNGHISEWFSVQRGCRQGDPISPYLFLLCVEILAIQIRTNNNIKGIKVGGKEFVISQYADDTSLILDGTERSLKQTLLELKFYADISGLGVNVEKTNVVWFGSMKGSDHTLCNEYSLHWETNNFSMLGIIMSTNLNDISQINYDSKLREVKSVFQTWSKRVLTPLGKLIVIKSLALPKLNHLFLALPNPSDDLIKQLQTMCFNFLWSNRPDKIKRTVVIQDYENGGLRMIDIRTFMNALKITWIRRQLIAHKDCFEIHNWLYPFTKKFFIYGSDFIVNNLDRIHNPFWYDVYKGLHEFSLSYKPLTWKEFLSTPLWFNISIKVGRSSCYIKRWHDAGISFINDLMDQNGNFYTLRVLEEKYLKSINFVIYEGVLAAVRSYLQTLSFQHLAVRKEEPICPPILTLILKNLKGCRLIYDTFMKTKVSPTSKLKWERDLNLERSFRWKQFYKLPFKCSKETNLQWFQLKILHRILPTNYLLTKMKIKDSELCTFCQQETESLTHLFWNCRLTQSFWNEFRAFMNLKNVNMIHNWQDKDIIFGSDNYDLVLNQLILRAKYFIYQKKLDENIPIFDSFKPCIKNLFQVEKYNAVKNGKIAKFEKSWSPYKTLITN